MNTSQLFTQMSDNSAGATHCSGSWTSWASFGCSTPRADALWMMDHIMNNRLSLELGEAYVHADALETDWAEVLAPIEIRAPRSSARGLEGAA